MQMFHHSCLNSSSQVLSSSLNRLGPCIILQFQCTDKSCRPRNTLYLLHLLFTSKSQFNTPLNHHFTQLLSLLQYILIKWLLPPLHQNTKPAQATTLLLVEDKSRSGWLNLSSNRPLALFPWLWSQEDETVGLRVRRRRLREDHRVATLPMLLKIDYDDSV